ncbi:MAG TPA: hypothetical protein PLI73_02525, partial [Candidatus Cloacimonadota bacterium]|nr:hypothetical protein [Candidatus Cloacimonadota bacterium]
DKALILIIPKWSLGDGFFQRESSPFLYLVVSTMAASANTGSDLRISTCIIMVMALLEIC